MSQATQAPRTKEQLLWWTIGMRDHEQSQPIDPANFARNTVIAFYGELIATIIRDMTEDEFEPCDCTVCDQHTLSVDSTQAPRFSDGADVGGVSLP